MFSVLLLLLLYFLSVFRYFRVSFSLFFDVDFFASVLFQYIFQYVSRYIYRWISVSIHHEYVIFSVSTYLFIAVSINMLYLFISTSSYRLICFIFLRLSVCILLCLMKWTNWSSFYDMTDPAWGFLH